jgi:hypothetical protein
MRRHFVPIALALLLGGCPDPVREDLEAAQGPEAPGVPRGPLHRPGQRCLACHRDGGEGPAFSVAGTVFARQGETAAASGVDVVLQDARGEQRAVVTNEVGNFWIAASEWAPTFPLRAQVRANGTTLRMRTELGREGSCGACHVGAGDARHMPGVYVEATP